MGLLDIFRIGQLKLDKEAATAECDRLRETLKDVDVLNLITVRTRTAETAEELARLEADLVKRRDELRVLDWDLSARRSQVVETDERLLLQEFGLFEPKYRLATVAEYKAKLDHIRIAQSNMVKERSASVASENWTLNGSRPEGQKMIRDYSKLIIRAFNTECDATIEDVKFFNIDAARKRIQKSYDVLNCLGERMSISISQAFLLLKFDELDLAYEFQVKKQEEKEEQKKQREIAREEAKLQRELDAAREVLAKEAKHFQRALSSLEGRLAKTEAETERELLANEIASIKENIEEVSAKQKEVDFRAQSASAGYVYIISNVGAFGEGIFKIGVTRRLEPMDRIDELGDASVPFDFDVHVLVFSDDAYGLELALHRHFASCRINMVNGRKEFFRSTIDEIEGVLRMNFSKPVEVTRLAPAAEYRQSIRLNGQSATAPTPESHPSLDAHAALRAAIDGAKSGPTSPSMATAAQ